LFSEKVLGLAAKIWAAILFMYAVASGSCFKLWFSSFRLQVFSGLDGATLVVPTSCLVVLSTLDPNLHDARQTTLVMIEISFVVLIAKVFPSDRLRQL
jgi:hypothetical protein